MNFRLTFERKHRVLMAQASGVIASQDLIDLDMASVAFLAGEEKADGPSVRGVYDFTEIAAITVPQTMAMARGSRSAIVRGQRVLVQSRRLSCGIVDAFKQSQALSGNNLLAVVDSLDEAFALLSLNEPHFEKIG